jgi:hypothetical protein
MHNLFLFMGWRMSLEGELVWLRFLVQMARENVVVRKV